MISPLFAFALAAAAPLPAASQAVRAPADGTYTFTTAHDGAAFGHTTVTVSHDAVSVRITENGVGAVSGENGTAQATLVLSPADLSPVSYVSTLSTLGESERSALAFRGVIATLSGADGNTSFTLAPNTSHFVVVDGALLSGFIALPAQMNAWNGAAATLVIPVYAQAVPLAVRRDGAAQRPAGVPANDASLSVDQPVPMTEWYDPTTLIPDEIDVSSLDLVLSRSR